MVRPCLSTVFGDSVLHKAKFVPVHVVTTYGQMKVWLYSFLTLALNAIEWSVSRPGRLFSDF
jgi:hypothetical protein